MEKTVLGRHNEIRLIDKFIKNKEANLITLVGRRRVGKTFLINTVYGDQLDFSFIGTKDGSKGNQLRKFADQISTYSSTNLPIKVPKSWNEALSQLSKILEEKGKSKKIVFFDEFPWIDGHKSGFLGDFGYWWNNWAEKQNILVIICGSAASWMIKKVINSKGGLHNRVSKNITIEPFTLAETKEFLYHKKIKLSYQQMFQLYMVTGGIPFYLEDIERGESAQQAIERMCFKKDGLLVNEFDNLYAALFDNPDRHIELIKTLATKWKGFTRKEIIENTSISNGGTLTNTLNELIASNFIIEIYPFGKKKKDKLYRLTDEYSLFYLRFMIGKRRETSSWQSVAKSRQYNAWSGYAFENICIKHAEQIKKVIGISGSNSVVSSYTERGNSDKEGMQIDMLLDRADGVINICEMKFYNAQWKMTKQDALKLQNRREQFRQSTKTRKALFNTVITSYGLIKNEYSLEAVDKEIKGEELFVE